MSVLNPASVMTNIGYAQQYSTSEVSNIPASTNIIFKPSHGKLIDISLNRKGTMFLVEWNYYHYQTFANKSLSDLLPNYIQFFINISH